MASCVRFDTALRHYGVSVRRRTKDDSEVPHWPLPLSRIDDLRVPAHRPGICRGLLFPRQESCPHAREARNLKSSVLNDHVDDRDGSEGR